MLEIVSDKQPRGDGYFWTESNIVRVPHSVLSDTGAFYSPNGTLTPLVVSKATSNLTRVQQFYEHVLFARLVNFTETPTGTRVAVRIEDVMRTRAFSRDPSPPTCRSSSRCRMTT